MVPGCVVRGRTNPTHLLFPARLRRARKAAKLSCAGLSKRAGLGQYTVAAIEAGLRLPRLPAVEHIGDVLRVSPAALAFGVDVPWEPREGDELRSAGLSDRVKAIRKALGVSMETVGRRLATSASTIQHIERGGMPTLDTLEALAKALGVSPAWLAFGIGPMELPTRRRVRLGADASAISALGLGGVEQGSEP